MRAILNSRFRSKRSPKVFESLESRVLLTGAFTNHDLAGTWGFAGTGAQGNIIFDNAGDITGGALVDNTGTPDVPAGNYTLNANGTAIILGGSKTLQAAINTTRDIAIASGTGNSGDLTVLISNHDQLNFSDADLSGSWTFTFNGESAGSNGRGTVLFDGNGHVTGGTATSGNGTRPIFAGSYTVNSDGTLTLIIITPTGNNASANALTFVGSLNASKDFIAANPADPAAAASGNNANLLTVIKSAGTYSNADGLGTWTIAGQGTIGSVMLDGAGHIASGSITTSDGTVRQLTGTYTISSKGAFTLNATTTAGGQSQKLVFNGALNAGHNAIIMNSVGANLDKNMTVLINSADHAPTLKTIAPFATAIDGQEFDISGSQLLAASNAVDIDGDPLSFQISSVGSAGTLEINHTPVAFPAFITSVDEVEWIANAGVAGNETAFTVKAFDGSLDSATAVPVVIKTVKSPTVSITANKPQASEINNGTTTGIGQFTISRINGVLTQPLTVHVGISGTATDVTDYSITSNGSAVTDTVTIPAGKPSVTVTVVPVNDNIGEGPETVILTIGTDNTYTISSTKTSATVTIKDSAPVISVQANRPTASEANNSATGEFTISRLGGDTTQPLVITVDLGGTATLNTDYFISGAFSGSITIPAGAKSATLTIVAMNNHVHNVPNLNVLLTLTAETPYFVNPLKSSATVTILDAG